MSAFDPVRPHAGLRVYKGHGLGNDYLVVEGVDDGAAAGTSVAGSAGDAWSMDIDAVRKVCHPHEGVGGDGIVVLLDPDVRPFPLRMFNPDGSEFERSGNGLRVLASHLHRRGLVETGRPFEVTVGGDVIEMVVHGVDAAGVYDVSAEMGRADFGGRDSVALETGPVPVHRVSVGNPHCVVFTEELGGVGRGAAAGAADSAGVADPFSRETLARLGPEMAVHPSFANGTNVQLARMATGDAPSDADSGERPAPHGGGPSRALDILIWERGVGHTTASGTSSCAVAVAAVATGRLDPGPVEIRMEGGVLHVDITRGLDVVLRGPVQEVFEGEIAPNFFG